MNLLCFEYEDNECDDDKNHVNKHIDIMLHGLNNDNSDVFFIEFDPIID